MVRSKKKSLRKKRSRSRKRDGVSSPIPEGYEKYNGRLVKVCKSHQYRDFKTGKCKNKPDYKHMYKNTEDLKPCKPHQYRHPITRRCVNLNNDEAHIVNAEDEPSFGNCIERSKIILRPIQQRIIKYMDNNDSMLVIHGVGIGKTLTSIGSSECFLDKNPDNHIVVVCPAGLISNYKIDMMKYGVKRDHAIRYTFYSYEKFLIMKKSNKPVPCDENTFLIIDEVHNLRNIDSSRYNAVLECAMKAKKRLLLTATPFVNFLTDFISLINLLYGKILVHTAEGYIDNIEKNPTENNMMKIYEYLDGKIDIKDSTKDPNFPSQKDEIYVKVPMSNEYYVRYERLIGGMEIDDFAFNNPSKFFHAYRKAVNMAGSQEYITDKLKAAVPIIKSGKSFIFTNWLNFGTSIVKKVLDKEKIKYALITGKTSSTERVEIINKFNNDEYDTLIITRAGGEGINLKGVRNVIVLDPTWNHASIYQVIGRGIRFLSHAHLPEEDRFVNVYLLVSTSPHGIDDETGDEKLYKIMESKREINKKVIDNLKKYCISSEKMSFSEKKPNDYVSNVLNDYDIYVTDVIKMIDELPDNISVPEFASMINCTTKNQFYHYMKIFKHILNTNNRNDLIEKINKIEKKAEIYFRKEKDDENDVDEEIEIEDEADTVEDETEPVEDTEIIEEPEIVEVKKVKRNVVDYIKVNKPKTMEEFPDLTEKEINTLLLKKWKTLSDEEKYF
jgi:superfamily II DNA or RNA helicase